MFLLVMLFPVWMLSRFCRVWSKKNRLSFPILGVLEGAFRLCLKYWGLSGHGHRFIKTPHALARRYSPNDRPKGPGVGLGPLEGGSPLSKNPGFIFGGSFRNPNHQPKPPFFHPCLRYIGQKKNKLTSAEATSRERPERKEAAGGCRVS